MGACGYIALWPVFLEAFPWPSHGLQWPFHTCPHHTHTYSSPSPSNQHVLGSPTLCFSPTPQLLWFHRQKRQLKSGPQPTSLSTGNNPELEEVGGDRKCIKSMNLAGVGLTLRPLTRENYRYQSSSCPTRTVLDGQNEGECGQENQNGPPGSQVDQTGTRDGRVGPPQLSTIGSTGQCTRRLLLPCSAVPYV